MAEVGVAFLSAFLGVLFDKMTSREVVDFMQRKKLNEGLLRKLKTAVLSVKAVLEDAEEKQFTKPFVKDWVDELKDVLYDADDILDEIATQALQSKLDAEFRTTTGKKIVFKLHDEREIKSKVMAAVINLGGIVLIEIEIDIKEPKLTVIGRVDPVDVVRKVRKFVHADLLTVGPA